uniref:Ribonuclease 1-like n=1 Tax=Tetranychus evansi TaxID=178897 RepID=A0A3G5ARP1_9ACAR|nr:ribonuclease 1-like [Tetranychus evansi]
MKSYLTIALLIGAIYGASARATAEDCERGKKFDIALLSVQWAPGVCASESKRCTVQYGNEFIIHGMWPNYIDNRYPQNCCFEPFLHKDNLDLITNELRRYWKSLYDNDSWGFWIHEWKKHGTCAKFSALKGQFNYFNTTLNLFKQMPIPNWLTAAGIKPSNTGIALEAVREAIRRGFHGRPQLACTHSSSGLPVLSEIRFCFNPESLAHVNCPAETNSCKSKTGKVLLLSA